MKNIVLPSHRSLTLYNISHAVIRTLLQTATAPSLSAFALVDADAGCAEELEKGHFSELLPQLDTISLDLEVWSNLTREFRQRLSAKTLVDTYSTLMPQASKDSHQVQRLRVYTHPTYSTSPNNLDALSDVFNRCASSIKIKKTAVLSTIFLEDSLQHMQHLPLDLRSAVARLVNACQWKGIEVVWEESPVEFEVDPVVSPIFWKRQREGRKNKSGQDTSKGR